jgi:predicted transposase YdaD
MCKALEDMRNEAEMIGIEKGRAEDMERQTINLALTMLEDGSDSNEQIAKITKLSLSEVKKLDEKCSA